jgi:hypothetical protein
VIDTEISSYLGANDRFTLYDTSVIDFKPEIRYEFWYDPVEEDEGPFGTPAYKLTNTRFDDKTKERIDKCIRFIAIQEQLAEHDRIVDMTPIINVEVELSIGKHDYRARPPYQSDEIIINSKFHQYNHSVELNTDKYGKIFCRKLYAHEVN